MAHIHKLHIYFSFLHWCFDLLAMVSIWLHMHVGTTDLVLLTDMLAYFTSDSESLASASAACFRRYNFAFCNIIHSLILFLCWESRLSLFSYQPTIPVGKIVVGWQDEKSCLMLSAWHYFSRVISWMSSCWASASMNHFLQYLACPSVGYRSPRLSSHTLNGKPFQTVGTF